MLIGILDNPLSYLPEKFAYKEFLEQFGHKVVISTDLKEIENDCDWIVIFMGFFNKKVKCKVLHDYASLSTPPFQFLKDKVKVIFNSKPNFRLFNSPFFLENLNFMDNINYKIREAGVDKGFFNIKNPKKEYDILYSGSERKGLLNNIENFAKRNFKILLLGNFSKEFRHQLQKYTNITFGGVINRKDLPNLYQSCEYGFNFIPDVFPYNYQHSLKLIEYCASNLKIISNKYHFVETFEKKNGGKFFYILDKFENLQDISKFEFITPNVNHLQWHNILKQIKFEDIFLQEI